MPPKEILSQSWRAWLSHSAPRAGPAWLQPLWTLLWCALVAFGFTVVGFVLFASAEGAWRNWRDWIEWYGRSLIVTCCIGFTVRALLDLGWRFFGEARVRAFHPLQRAAFFGGAPMLGTLLAWPLGMWLAGYDVVGMVSRQQANGVAGSVLLALLISFLFYQFFALKNRQIEAERRATEARLTLLQGQMEPHFLFNTLANVVSLMEADMPRARLMLESFTDYLRGSLGGLRAAEQTLDDELALIEAYLRVVKIRMEGRLSYRIEVPEPLRRQRLPSLSLQPLVENAIVHGLEPKIEGGCVRIAARAEAGALSISVTDDGLGLDAVRSDARRGTGTAIGNLRERLAQRHGTRGRLQIEAARPCGVRATLTLPLSG